MYSTLLTLGSSYTIHAQSGTENYIKTTECLKADCTEKKETVVYYDGLGREKQILQVGASPLGKTIVTPIEYDGFGRQAREYLPFPIGSAANTVVSPTTNGNSFYSTATGDSSPFSEKTFENSPLNRVLAQAAPGKSWATGSGHEIKFSYQANKSSDEVIIFDVKTTYNATAKIYDIELTRRLSPVYYANGTLYKTVTTDENGQPIVEFKNKEGQVILKRIDTSDGRHDTYYVYDIYGNLTYVLPPKLLDLYYGSNPLRADWQKLMDELGYQYLYDEKNRLVEKQLPGKGREFMVYDNQDRLTLQQDINQRTGTNKGWTFFKYDKFGRMVYSGFFKNTATRGSMQTALNNKRTPNNEERTSVGLGNNGTGLFYTNNQFPNGSLTVQSVQYYDHYQNLGVTPFSIIDGQNVIGINDTRTKGLAVATYTNVLGETTWNKAYTFYDEEYLRPVASHLVNYLNGYQTTASVLDFRGKVKNTITKHKLSESEGNEITVKEEFDYYPNELLKYQTHQVNNNPKEYIVQNSYNEINQLTSKKVGNTNSSTPLQKVDYKYNIRGWLTDINNIDVTETGTYKDLFSFRIYYDQIDDPTLAITNQPFGRAIFNGNIAQTKWKTGTDNVTQEYLYKYDGLNRLMAARNFYNKIQIQDAYSEYVKGYDKNGNILGFIRNGNRLSENIFAIDDLKYDYQANSNKLLNVSDDKTEDGFNDKNKYTGTTANDARNDYMYDANGNLIQDLNKGITKISYNYLNLPTEVLWGNGDKISYAYDASGAKLAKYVLKNMLSSGESTYYMNGFQYSQEAGKGSQSVLQFFPTAEGYVNVTDGTAFNYVYNYTDHLGNVRLSYQKESNGSLKVLEENNYYPFGLKHSGYNNTNLANANYKYKYNGKELQDEFNINLYDYGARNYDPTIGRWFNVDPLAEKYYELSPYNYAVNNPVFFVDPDGMAVEDIIKININTGVINIQKAAGDDVVQIVDNKGNVIKDEKGKDQSYTYGKNGSFLKENNISYENVIKGEKFNSQIGHPQTRISFGDPDKANKFFEFASKTNVEFGLYTFFDSRSVSEFSEVITNHSTNRVYGASSLIDNILSKDKGILLTQDRHNHPAGSPPSGFNNNLTPGDLIGDRAFHKNIKLEHGNQITTKGEVYVPSRGRKPSISVMYDDKSAKRK
ncbi:hypothetical protein AS589_17305 [Empedobacter brevis]|uniref:DUF6443 domain-containing protein n=1 Tax=Empedobacter brevis TaxID=247 RepID=UPI00131F8B1B|nr:DUF6443 domain-containing protein [Empedobacter brevis]QHC86413.1 hypothetical protein AS589_17305 [Empedobacter brevis]